MNDKNKLTNTSSLVIKIKTSDIGNDNLSGIATIENKSGIIKFIYIYDKEIIIYDINPDMLSDDFILLMDTIFDRYNVPLFVHSFFEDDKKIKYLLMDYHAHVLQDKKSKSTMTSDGTHLIYYREEV